jgi:hypothetical protein
MTARYAREESQGRQKRVRRRPEPLAEYDEGDFERAGPQLVSLEPARRAAAERLPHENPEIEGARVDQQAFEDIRMPAQVSAAHPAGVVHVSERPFDVLPAATQEPLAAPPAHAAPIAVDGLLRLRRGRPVAAPAIGLGDVRPHADRVQVDHCLIAVTPPVGDEFGEDGRRGTSA